MKTTKAKPRSKYEVRTWDMEKQRWTPQQGVRCGPYTLMGLRKALRKLREGGYEITRRAGVSIMVERRSEAP